MEKYLMMGRGSGWTDTELKLLFELYPDHNNDIQTIAEKLGKSVSSVKSMAARNGVKRSRKVVWTEKMVEYLKNNYADVSAKDIAVKLRISHHSVLNRAFLLGLKKSKEFRMLQGKKVAAHPASISKRFRHGHVPVNKGQKIPEEIKERIKHTFFKKGHKPHNTKRDGYISKRLDKRSGKEYLYVRISECNWQEYHRYVWEKERGKIPTGMNLVFKDGNTLNCDINNLELLTNAELMKRNSIHNYPEELKIQIRKLAKLKKILKNF